jgi:hypothetical protein
LNGDEAAFKQPQLADQFDFGGWRHGYPDRSFNDDAT